jgi:hypothetical protein
MQSTERSITSFRRRLLRLINERFDGRYTYLAQRAGIPISSLEHCIHEATRLPGGDHLLRMAHALEVTVHFLVTGEDPARPADGPPRFVPGVRPTTEPPTRTPLTIPVFVCTCPDACPLTQSVPPRTAARSTMVLERDLVGPHNPRHLIAVAVTPGCPASEWRPGTRLVVAWGVRPSQWEALALIHAEGRCQWGHLKQVEDVLFFADEPEGDFRILPAGDWTILGTAVAVVAPL